MVVVVAVVVRSPMRRLLACNGLRKRSGKTPTRVKALDGVMSYSEGRRAAQNVKGATIVDPDRIAGTSIVQGLDKLLIPNGVTIPS